MTAQELIKLTQLLLHWAAVFPTNDEQQQVALEIALDAIEHAQEMIYGTKEHREVSQIPF